MSLEAVGFVLAEFEPKRSHRAPVRGRLVTGATATGHGPQAGTMGPGELCQLASSRLKEGAKGLRWVTGEAT